MEYNVFRDYCKAENSDDEDVNHDLQSRLYAEIYYGSNDTDNVDVKTDIKLETTNIDDEKLHSNAGTSKNDTSVKSSSNENYRNTCPLNNTVDNSALIDKEDKPDIKSIDITNEAESLFSNVDKKGDSNIPCERSLKESNETIEPSKTTCYNVEGAKSDSGFHRNNDSEKDVDVKPEIEDENKPFQQEYDETVADQCVQTCTSVHNTDNNNKNCQEVERNETNVNIFKKYEYSKSFINKLYLEKYENLEKKLEEEKTRSSGEKQQESNKYTKSVDEPETGTKYEVLSSKEKIQRTAICSEEITVLSSESESDSEDSILEVPIPPKTPPPVIHLQDSDESYEISSCDTDIDQECTFVIENENDLVRDAKKKTSVIDRVSDSDASIIDCIDDTLVTEDIMLNCTEVQKGASNMQEIREMSKAVQLEQRLERYNSVTGNESHTKNISKSDKLFLCTSNKDNVSKLRLPSKTVNYSNSVYERDKNESINFAEDVVVTNFLNSKETAMPNRKRCHEDDNEPSTSIKQGRDTASDSKRPKLNPEQHKVKDKTNQESWEEYFFHPMSENVKAFYNEPRGQENFDIKEIQNKMSKDPRLWAILDEDLMPDLLKRQRYWNMKCYNCRQQGHQKHNCPRQYKPVSCHICGTQGHTETRCPQKMCLTCGRKQGTFRKTCESCRTLYCNMCNAVGHKSTECPDLWRRFHQTTRTSEIKIPENLSEVMKPADLLYCCNCTKRGHDSSTCNEYRWSQHFPTPPFVSNYVSEPGDEVPIHGNPTEDVIPLTTKTKKSKNMVFLQDKDDLENTSVVYSYGAYYTKKPVGEEIKRKLCGEQVQSSHLTNLLKGRVFPSFLDQLIKIVKFEIKIYHNSNKELMIRVRSTGEVCRYVFEIFIYWLRLDNEDKRLNIHTNLPHGTKKLLKLLITKRDELQKNVQDPNYLCSQIQRLKASLNGIKDSTTSVSTTEKLLDLRSNLLKVYHTKPKCSDSLSRLKRVIKCLKKSSSFDVPLSLYFNTIVIYNRIFVPRTLSEVELQRFFKKYYKYMDKQQLKETENKGTKKQKKKKSSTPYETFIESLQRINKHICEKTRTSEVCSSINTERQDKQISSATNTPVEHVSTDNSIQPDIQVVTQNADSVSIEICNDTESADVIPVDCVQLPRTQNIASNNETTSNVTSIDTNVSSKAIKNLPSGKANPLQSNIEKQIEAANSNNEEVVTTDNLQQEQDSTVSSELSATKKKKSKKAKKIKLDLENDSEVTDINSCIENKAKQIMNEALEFNLPYMNKAVEEVRKRINDKNLKQEHIDTLIRLINLENDHRKYVSSFCNYLQ